MPYLDVAKIAVKPSDAIAAHAEPPNWAGLMALVMAPNDNADEPCRKFGMNPAYLGRVALVEAAAGLRASEDFAPPANSGSWSAKALRQKKAALRTSACSTWVIPRGELDPWCWTIKTDPAIWEGLIMPRRV
jgi:hypothetical protein